MTTTRRDSFTLTDAEQAERFAALDADADMQSDLEQDGYIQCDDCGQCFGTIQEFRTHTCRESANYSHTGPSWYPENRI